MGEKYLIDTNVVISLTEGKLDPKAYLLVSSVIDDMPFLSVINKIKLLGFSFVNPAIIELVEFATILPLTDSVVNKTISIRKNKRLKLPDAIIAATAIEYDLVLLTRNISDFQNIKDLLLLNPWTL